MSVGRNGLGEELTKNDDPEVLMSVGRNGLGEELTKNDGPEVSNVCCSRERVRRRAYQE